MLIVINSLNGRKLFELEGNLINGYTHISHDGVFYDIKAVVYRDTIPDVVYVLKALPLVGFEDI